MPNEFQARPVVLVLEDEPLLMMSLVDLVEEAGCEVVEARRTADAIAILEQRSDIRVVMSDLDVKGSVMGMKLIALIRERWPPIELILTSSAPRPPHIDEIPARGIYVNKPFDGPRIVKAIRGFVSSAKLGTS